VNALPFVRALLLVVVAAPGALAGVVTYSLPTNAPFSTDYTIVVEGTPVQVCSARVLDAPFAGKEYDYGGNYSFANFDVSGPVTVRITSGRPLGKTVVRPQPSGVQLKVENEHSLLLTLPGPQKLSIEPDGRKAPLLLFANPPEKDAPKPGDPGVVYFGPGLHDAGRIYLTNNQTLYLHGGAFVKGGVRAEGNNIRILGRGILDSSDYEWRKGPTPHVISIVGTNIEVSGITIRGASHWTLVPQRSQHVTVRNVKICGSRVQNDDGINPCNTRDMLITDCFIRSDDDCVAMKGLQLGHDVERVRVEKCILWCDRARIFLLGHESRARYMRNLVLTDLDIIHFTMTPFLFEPGEEMRLEDVLIENVRLHGEGQREVARLQPVVNQYMQNKVPGHIEGIVFRNVTLAGAPGSYQFQLNGADDQHATTNVVLDNVVVAGEKLAAGSPRLKIGKHASGIQFR
jgi:Glycosyl hydrolases family 28